MKTKDSKPQQLSDQVSADTAGKISDYQLERLLLITPQAKWFELKGEDGPLKTFSIGEIRDLYQKELATYRRGEAYREWAWATSKGTVGDQVYAHTLLLLQSVSHNLESLDQLISMVTPQSRHQLTTTVKTLQELLPSVILPPDRKLVPLSQRPLHSQRVSPSTALLWYVEDQIRSSYHRLLDSLEKLTFDTLEVNKVCGARFMADLLAYSPEQEQFLLTKLANKLGDPKHAVGSKVAHMLSAVLARHPNMKLVMVKEVERLLFRPNVSERAQYNALCFLNQVVFQPGDVGIARRMLATYLRLFSVLSQKKEGAINARMMKALLAGAARAFPFSQSKGESSVAQEHVDALFNLVHRVEAGAGIQALSLLFQVLDTDGLVSDRFYCSLYRTLLSPASSSHIKMFLNLLYCALKKDHVTERVRAFVKRILQMVHQPIKVQCGLLFLVSRLNVAHPSLLQDVAPAEEEDGPEHYPDVKDPEDEGEEKAQGMPGTSAGWVHCTSYNDAYNPFSRDPRFANANNEPMSALELSARSFHAAVTKFYAQLRQPIQYSGDPLFDFSLSRFLEKWVDRNPKKPPPKTQQSSIFGIRKIKAMQKTSSTSDDLWSCITSKAAGGKKSGKKEMDDDEEELDEAFEEYLDFAGFDDTGRKKKKKGEEESEEEFSDEDEIEEFDDDDDELKDAFKDFDGVLGEEELEEDLNDELDEEEDSPPRKKKKSVGRRSNLVDAEEINEMLEDNDRVGVAAHDYVNSDKAHPKQLQWERKMENYVKGYSKKKKSKFSKKRKFK